MDDWRRRMPAPHLTATMPHFHGLDFGRTMPLRHPPATAHGRGAFDTSPQSFIPFSHPLAPIPIPMASRELPILPSSSLASPQLSASSTDSSRQQNVEKKRWQTANFRWMFTKRKGKKDDLSVEVGHYENEYGFAFSKTPACNGYNTYICHTTSLPPCFSIITYYFVCLVTSEHIKCYAHYTDKIWCTSLFI